MVEKAIAAARLTVGFVLMFVFVAVWWVLLLPFLPWRTTRIKLCNYFGKTAGSTMMWLSGCPLTWEGSEHLDASRPAIYVSNHTSTFDPFLAMWLSPVGTVGVAKKQVVYYPLLGQLYLLSGHLRIDRGNNASAVQSLVKLGELVRRHRLSIFMWPEGTRSQDGRLLPFKKGIVHMALQTGLPVVPVVVIGAHKAWEKGTLAVRQVPITIHALPAIDTSQWDLARIEEHLAELQRVFAEALPEDQQPIAA
jgi:lysophosphatidate acyltransferase